MSDGYVIRRYRRHAAFVPAMYRKRWFFWILLILLLAGAAGMFWFISCTGIVTEVNPQLSHQMIRWINLERQSNNIDPVQEDAALSGRSLVMSRQKMIQSAAYAPGPDGDAGGSTDVFVIPVFTWLISGYDAREQVFDRLENSDSTFRNHVLNRDFRKTGVGITSDGLNYFLVVTWQ